MKFKFVIFLIFVSKIFVSSLNFDKVFEECGSKFELMKLNGKLYSPEAVELAVEIKEIMENEKFPASKLIKFKELKEKLPMSVRVIAFGEETYLYNKHYGGFLYAVPDSGVFDTDRRNVFLWIQEDIDGTGRWNFTTNDGGKSFLLKNIHFDEFLFASGSFTYDEKRRNIFTRRNKTADDCEWIVDIVGEDEIRLKFKLLDEYAFADFAKSSVRRHVFTWRKKGCDEDYCVWKLRPEVTPLTHEEMKILHNYSKKFNLKFDTLAEQRRAVDNLKDCLALIKENQELNQINQVGYQLDLHRFSHMSEDEFASKYLGLLPPPASDTTSKKRQDTSDDFQCGNLPDAKDWKELKIVSNVKDQKECGSCYIFSSTSAVESAVAIEYGITAVNLSRQDSLNCLQDPDTNKTNGCKPGRPEWVWLDAQTKNGLVMESAKNVYKGLPEKCDSKASKSSFADVESWKKVSDKGLSEEVEERIKCRLATHGPLHVGMTVTKTGIGMFRSGIFDDSNGLCDTNKSVNHAMLLVGYGEKLLEGQDTPTKFWMLQNSWGVEWGDQGYLFIKRGINLCNFIRDAHYPVLSKAQAKIDKPKVCKDTEDVFDSDKKYVKTLCLIEDELSRDEAQLHCLKHQMRLFRSNSKESKETLMNFANKTWKRKNEFSSFVDNLMANTSFCSSIEKRGEDFVEVNETDCGKKLQSICEFIDIERVKKYK